MLNLLCSFLFPVNKKRVRPGRHGGKGEGWEAGEREEKMCVSETEDGWEAEPIWPM